MTETPIVCTYSVEYTQQVQVYMLIYHMNSIRYSVGY